ncbi:MAG: hypothetical protein HOM55_06665 [Proteobacteria bacterium]|jgi:hypothetical protein|nr:hypothetical protein [Pseudomonadota bacterium]
MIDETTREDVENAIRAKGLEVDDFEIFEEPDPPGDGDLYFVKGTVTIKRKSNDIEKAYRAGHGTAWPTEIIDDLNRGLFES